MPHPPIVLPEIGRGEELKIKDTYDNLCSLGKEIKELRPDTIIIITPHGTMFRDAIALSYEDNIKGDMKRFGAPQVSLVKKINKSLTRKISNIAEDNNIPVILLEKKLLNKYHISLTIDHGALVPLYFIEEYYSDYNIVHITYAPIGDIDLYKFGMAISKAVEELSSNAVIIASGDLSHRLKDDGPYDYSPYGKKFDTEFIEHLKEGDVLKIFNMDRKTIEEAGECGRRSVLIMLGALEGKKFHGELKSYEGTFGVGYGIMKFNVTGTDNSKLKDIEEKIKNIYEVKLKNQNPYVRLARESLTTYVSTGKMIKELPHYVTEEMRKNIRGVFVSIKKFGELRGCIGTTDPTTESVAWEIIRNAVEAGIYDPRFEPVEENELADLDFSVDVLTEAEDASYDELNPKEFGVIVSSRGRRGLLLPDLEGVDTVDEQLSIALMKAGIRKDEDYKIQKFRVIRYKED